MCLRGQATGRTDGCCAFARAGNWKAEIDKWVNKHTPLGARKLLEPIALCDSRGKGDVEVNVNVQQIGRVCSTHRSHCTKRLCANRSHCTKWS